MSRPHPYGRARRRTPSDLPPLDPVGAAVGRILDAERRHPKPLPNEDRVVLLEIADRVRPDTLSVTANTIDICLWSGLDVPQVHAALHRLVRRGYLRRSRERYGERSTDAIRWTITP